MKTTKSFAVFHELWNNISKKRQKQFRLVFLLTIASSLSEVVCLGSIFPFIGIITNPEKVFTSQIMSVIVNYLNLQNYADLILPLTLVFALFSIISGSLCLLLIRISLKIANATGTDLGHNIYRKTLYQPYEVHISRNSSDIISAVAQKSNTATSSIIAITTFGTTFTIFLSIISTMLFINFKITILSALLISLAYIALSRITKKKLTRNGAIISVKQNDVMRNLQDGLSAIRDILLDGTQESYSKSYLKDAQELQESRSENMFISQAPRYTIETFAMILLSLFVFFTSLKTNNVIDILPIIGFFALSAQKLLPIMQQMYGSWSEIIGNSSTLNDVIELLKQPLPNITNEAVTVPILFQKNITLSNISFQYKSNSNFILNSVNLKIPKGSRVGIIGSSGNGKSTTMDILLGLIEPTEGEILVDGITISTQNRRSWQKIIAHVPQTIFLANLTIAENIAFGTVKEKIDYKRVHEAAIRANAYEFIKKCDQQYNTLVGEKGVLLSGGQRQRIGIARALYKEAEILFFDEATSSLDNETEQEVMKAIDELDRNLTIFIISHRLSTLRNCTHFIRINNGEIINISSYEQIEEEYQCL